jgi:nucleotide-binding universal stress UspA family protein
MWTINKILVATDFTPASTPAIDAAFALASRFGASIVLMHCYQVPVYSGPLLTPSAELTAAIEQAASKQLEELAHDRRLTGVAISTSLNVGQPWEQILRAAKSHKADLIVVGSRGLRGLPRALLGSTAERVVRYAPIPVLTQHWRDSAASEDSARAKAADQLAEQWLI